MHWSVRPLFMGLVSIAIGARCEAQPANPSDGKIPFDAFAQLRPASSFEAVMLEEGLCRSVTLRSLVATLKTSDLIVYVNVRRLSSRGLGGGLQFVAATATRRVVRVVIGLTADRTVRLALLGHELQHAVEVAGAPNIRSSTALADYYRSHGLAGATQHAYETVAARLTEERIRRELATSSTACVDRSPSVVELTPRYIAPIETCTENLSPFGGMTTIAGHQWTSPSGRYTFAAFEGGVSPGVAVIDHRAGNEVVQTFSYPGRPHGVDHGHP